MGVRTPRWEDDDHDVGEFGIVALDSAWKKRSSPIPLRVRNSSTRSATRRFQSTPHGHIIALSTAIDRAGSDAFESEPALPNKLHPVFKAQRVETSIGVLGSLRAMLPFRALDPAELLAVQREEHIREDAEHEQLDAEQKGDPRDDCEHFV